MCTVRPQPAIARLAFGIACLILVQALSAFAVPAAAAPARAHCAFGLRSQSHHPESNRGQPAAPERATSHGCCLAACASLGAFLPPAVSATPTPGVYAVRRPLLPTAQVAKSLFSRRDNDARGPPPARAL